MNEGAERPKMSAGIRAQLEVIREIGKHNMFDFRGVQEEAFHEGYYALAGWMSAYESQWGVVVMGRVDIVEEGEGG